MVKGSLLKIYKFYFNLTKSSQLPSQDTRYKMQQACNIHVLILFPITTMTTLAIQERSTIQLYSPATFLAHVTSNDGRNTDNILHLTAKSNKRIKRRKNHPKNDRRQIHVSKSK